MRISYDPVKRAKTLAERGLDFADAKIVFADDRFTIADARRNYGELRFQTFGKLRGRFVVITWTPRDDTRRVISMRYCHDREAEKWKRTMDRSG